MSDEDICEIVVTAADLVWLVEFTRRLLAERLVACGQHVEKVRSVYRWEGKIEDDFEARVALHTRRGRVEDVLARIVEEHPYRTPCVVVLPIVDAYPGYADWVRNETAETVD